MKGPLSRVLLAIVVVATLLSVCGTVTSDTDWASEEACPTSGGYGQAVVGTEDDVYVVKCSDATSPCYFYSFSAEDQKWHEEPTGGLADGTFRNGTSLAWDGDETVYALCGARYEDPSRGTFLRFMIGGDEWEPLPDTPGAQGAGNALAWSGYDSALYAFTGSPRHNAGRTVFLRYSPETATETATWTEMQAIWRTTDDGASLVWAGDEHLYALRGEYSEDVPNGEFARFHIPSQEWEPLAPLPDPRGVGDGGCLLWIRSSDGGNADYIFALSGGSVDEQPGHGFYRYSISSGEWAQLTDIPCPIGYYVGNRLAYCSGSLYYWQGSPTTGRWLCGGSGFFSMDAYVAGEQDPAAADHSMAGVAASAAAVASGVLINEVEMNPPGCKDSGKEWVELYNASSAPVSLSGWQISYMSYCSTGEGTCWVTLPYGDSIPPWGHYVYTFKKLRLNDSNGWQISLKDGAGVVVDRTPGGLKDTANDSRSWQRIPDSHDTDSRDDWEFRTSSNGSAY